MQKKYLIIICLGLLSLNLSSYENLEWQYLGGPIGGMGYDIRINPNNTKIMYVTDANAGAFKSIDGGQSWFTINKGLDVTFGHSGDGYPVFCLTIDPNNPNTIWCGMKDQSGIFKSTDGGKNWKNMTKGIKGDAGLTFRGIAIDPNNSNIIYIAGEISSFIWSKDGEEKPGIMFDRVKGMVYKSTNGGKNWQQIWEGNNLARYIFIHPQNSDIIYVSTGIFDREAANSDPKKRIPGGVGILKSSDGGKTWKVFDKKNGLTSLYISSLFMHPENPDILIAGAGHDYYSHAGLVRDYPHPKKGGIVERGGIFITTNGGESWKKTLDVDSIYAVEICKNDPKICYAANEWDCYISKDGGFKWQKTNPETGHGNPYGPQGFVAGFPMDFTIDPQNPKRLFVNNYGGGNFYSEDAGQSWVNASKGYSGAICTGGITIDRKNPLLVYVGARSGIFRSNDGGENWQGMAFPPARFQECTALDISPDNPDIVLCNLWDAGRGIFRSTNGGKNWQFIEHPLQGGQEHALIMSIKFAPSQPQVIYMGTGHMELKFDRADWNNPAQGVLRSTDAGKSWKFINSGQLKNANVFCVEVDPTQHNTVYVGTCTKGLFKTTDGGKKWKPVLEVRGKIISVKVNPANPSQVIAATTNGIYISNNGGKRWSTSIQGLDPEGFFTAVLFDKKNPQGLWAADMQSGVYYKKGKNSPWTPVNKGLRMRSILFLELSHDGNHIYAATSGGGTYRLDVK